MDNTFRSGNETLFLVNILNTMYNDNLRQINNLCETLNNSNNQIRNLLVQILHGNQGTRRNPSRRHDINTNNLEYNFGRNIGYLIRNTSRQNNRNNHHNVFDNYAQSIFENFFQPIEIYPTQSQIETATRHVRYCDIARPVNTACPISMDDFNDNDMVTVIRHCGHTFHTESIMNWFRSNCRCPVCRYDIRDFTSNVSNQFFAISQDSSNNNVGRNNTNNTQNTSLNEEYINNVSVNSLETLQGGIFDASGNYTINPTDILASFLLQTLNRNRNTR